MNNINILCTSPFSIVKVASDIAKALNGKLILGNFNPYEIEGNVIIVGNPDGHAKWLYDSIANNSKVKTIILYLTCEGVLDFNQVSWLRYTRNYIITPSNYVKQKLDCVGIDVTDVIPHGVSYFGNAKSKSLVFGYIGGYQKRKYPDYLYPKFYNYIKDKDFRIITNHQNPYARLFPKVIHGNYNLPYESIINFYKEINFYVNISDSEGFGITPLEAMAMGNIVILPKLPVFTELYPSNLVIYYELTGKRFYESFSWQYIEHFEYNVDSLISAMNRAVSLSDNEYYNLSLKSIEFAKKYSISNTYSKLKQYFL